MTPRILRFNDAYSVADYDINPAWTSLADSLRRSLGEGDHSAVVHEFVERAIIEEDRCAVLEDGLGLGEPAACYYAGIAGTLGGCAVDAEVAFERVPVSIYGDTLHLSYSAFIGEMRALEEAIARQQTLGKPGFLISALPGSASSYVSAIVSGVAQVPIVRINPGVAASTVAVGAWLRTLAQGGCVTHDHVAATPHTLERIADAGISDIFIQYRDPREAMWSGIARDGGRGGFEMLRRGVIWANRWLDGWLEAAEGAKPFRIHFIDHRTVKTMPEKVFTAIFDAVGYAHDGEELRKRLKRADEKRSDHNFRSADSSEWRKNLTSDEEDVLFRILTPRVRHLVEGE